MNRIVVALLVGLIAISIIIVISYSYLGNYLSNRNIINPRDLNKDGELLQKNAKENTFEEGNYELSIFTLEDVNDLTLHLNLDQKLTAEEALSEYDCSRLTSGGFYTKENSPIGLFVSEGKLASKQIVSALFNGYISISNEGEPSINYSPVEGASLSLQSGPLLLKDGKTLLLNIKNEDKARRIVLGQNIQNDLIFISIYEKGSVFSGPSLEELPKIIKNFSDRNEFNVIDAINLDGGSASAFISPDQKLTELTRVGSFFCVK